MSSLAAVSCRSLQLLGRLRKLQKPLHRLTSYKRLQDTDATDYIHISSIPTFAFQDSIPPVPVPTLQDTCRHTLDALIPLVSQTEIKHIARLCSQFAETEGRTLQQELLSLSKGFLKDLSVLKIANMECRASPPSTDCTVSILLPEGPGSGQQLVRAAILTRSILRYANTLKGEKLKPAVWPVSLRLESILNRSAHDLKTVEFEGERVVPQCMDEFRYLFSSCRIPQLGRDEIERYEAFRHIVVLRHGHIYTFDVVDEEGHLASTSEIYYQLEQIDKRSHSPALHSVAALTGECRDTWARLRQKLMVNNREALNTVESAICVICLDDDDPPPSLHDQILNFQFSNGCNRWYDKTLHTVIGKYGQSAGVVGAAICGGTVAMRFLHSVVDDAQQSKFAAQSQFQGTPISPVSKIEFDVDSELRSAIHTAKTKLLQLKRSLPFKHATYNGFDDELIKSKRLSPDAVVQVACQMAFYSTFGRLPFCIQPVMKSWYKGGVTEMIATVSPESAAFIRSAVDGNASDNSRLFDMLTAASNKHKAMTIKAMLGEISLSHMRTLCKLAEEGGYKIPLFENETFLTALHSEFEVYTAQPAEVDDFKLLMFIPTDIGSLPSLQLAYHMGKGYHMGERVKNITMTSSSDVDSEFISHVKRALDVILAVVKAGPRPQH